MATLKMTTDDFNTIWLPNVRRVETQCHIYSDADYEYAWECVLPGIETVRERVPGLANQIQSNVQDYGNRPALRSIKKGEHAVLLLVVSDLGDDVRCENWLVRCGQNYLLENGKTIDRI